MTFGQALLVILFISSLLGISLPKFFVYDNPTISQAERDCAWQGSLGLLNEFEKAAVTLGTHLIVDKASQNDKGPAVSIITQELYTPFNIEFATTTITCIKSPDNTIQVGEATIIRRWPQRR